MPSAVVQLGLGRPEVCTARRAVSARFGEEGCWRQARPTRLCRPARSAMAGTAAEKENVDLADLAVQPAPLEDGAKRLKACPAPKLFNSCHLRAFDVAQSLRGRRCCLTHPPFLPCLLAW